MQHAFGGFLLHRGCTPDHWRPGAADIRSADDTRLALPVLDLRVAAAAQALACERGFRGQELASASGELATELGSAGTGIERFRPAFWRS